MLFGALSYSGTDNIGDEIQSIAAIDRLPRVDHYLDRDNLAVDGEKLPAETLVIMNGWFMQHPERWPPSLKLRPLYISMHITREKVSSQLDLRAHEVLTTAPLAKYLRRYAPIGARDLATRDLLNDAGIESYFSGCLTLSLQRPNVTRNDDLIVLNDLPQNVIAHVRNVSRKFTFITSHLGIREPNSMARFARAREHLALYARASCVVTGRLHCALPCLAMGTPVILVDVAGDQYRFSGLRDLLHHCRPNEFISEQFDYNIDAPPPNKQTYLAYREDLIRRMSDFVSRSEECVEYDNEYAHPSPQDQIETFRHIYQSKGRDFPS